MDLLLCDGALAQDDVLPVAFPYFGGRPHERFNANDQGGDVLIRNVPVRRASLADGETLVATVFDLLCANYGLDRGLGGDCAKSFGDNVPYTPASQAPITGVSADKAIAVARGFADNAEKTKGRSTVIIGAGMNHCYHQDMGYRAIINFLMMCGTIGVSGGGWAHYVGQEALRPLAGWMTLAFARDWVRPLRRLLSVRLDLQARGGCAAAIEQVDIALLRVEEFALADLCDQLQEPVARLNLFEHLHGDSRDRGQAMVELKRLYEAAGFELSARELPDFLPVVLEYLSRRDLKEARELLADCATILASVARSLIARRSRYAAVLQALLVIAGEKPIDAAKVPPVRERPEALDRDWAEKPAFAAPDGERSDG